MTKNKLIQTLAKNTNVTREQAGAVLNNLLEIIGDELAAGEKVQITGFGTFEVRERGERTGRNPYTGETIQVAASRHPAFVAGKNLKEKVK